MPTLRLDDPDLDLDTMLRHWPQLATVFLRRNMLCVGCLVAPFHTIDDASAEYGMTSDHFLAELQSHLSDSA